MLNAIQSNMFKSFDWHIGTLDHVEKGWMKFDFNLTFVPILSNISLVFWMLGLLWGQFEYTDGFSAISYATALFKIY